jgi:hypothetical protein
MPGQRRDQSQEVLAAAAKATEDGDPETVASVILGNMDLFKRSLGPESER